MVSPGKALPGLGKKFSLGFAGREKGAGFVSSYRFVFGFQLENPASVFYDA